MAASSELGTASGSRVLGRLTVVAVHGVGGEAFKMKHVWDHSFLHDCTVYLVISIGYSELFETSEIKWF